MASDDEDFLRAWLPIPVACRQLDAVNDGDVQLPTSTVDDADILPASGCKRQLAS